MTRQIGRRELRVQLIDMNAKSLDRTLFWSVGVENLCQRFRWDRVTFLEQVEELDLEWLRLNA